MNAGFSFRKRMLFSFWVVLLLALLVPPWYYFRALSGVILSETQRNAVQQLNLLHRLISREGDFQTTEELQARLVELGDQSGARITYIAAGGNVIADSQVPFSEIPNLDNHASRPEIVEAHSQEVGVVVRFSRTNQSELIYAARTVQAKGAIPAGVLRLAAPLSTVKGPLERLKGSFLLFVALFSGATVLLSYVLVRRLNAPIRSMIDTAEAISTRDFKRRIHSSPGNEFYPLTQAINKMAESIEDHIRTITEQKQQLEAVFNAMQEGVMVLDPRGKIQGANRALSGLIANVARAVGRRPLEVIVDMELQKLCDRVMASRESETEARPHKMQVTMGSDRTYDVNIVGLPARQREIGAVIVFHDISELKRLERVRQDFVANVSHELRTPLTSIKGYTETLLSETEPKPDMLTSFLQVILRNTDHMVKMVQDLLQLARLEAHDTRSKPVPINGASALMTAWKACAHHAEAKGLLLKNNLPDAGIWVSADFDQLVQVFRNLLENAIRYSPPNETLTVACEPHKDRREFGLRASGGESSMVAFSVRDEGPGIGKQHQQRIFERFYRVEKHRGDQGGSTGLGLAICRHIIRNHGGAIWVQSPNEGETKGTTFFFTLQRELPTAAVRETPSTST